MTFEEFFQKKKISLVALEQGEPSLFSEFKVHFEQMGEKSFDHTKKYWFNKLRLRFPTPTEVKVEKVAIANPLAEQTINETLSETPSSPSVGFKPRFKAGATKPAEPSQTPESIQEKPAENADQAAPSPALGFKPKFKAGITKPAEPSPNTEPAPSEAPVENPEQAAPKLALGFKPKFKAGVTKSAESSNTEPVPSEAATEKPEQETSKPALGFKSKFKTGVTKTTQSVPEKTEETKEESPAADQPTENNEAKPIYKPRFNMKNIKPKEDE
jgi:hypothetical protein